MSKPIKRIAVVAMVSFIVSAASAASFLVESRPSLQLSSPGLAAPIELGSAIAPSFRYDERPDVDFGDRGEMSAKFQTRMFESQALVRCKVDQTDLVIANVGSGSIEAGTTIRWQVKGSGQRGYLDLGTSLDAGHSLRARDALGEPAAGTCMARAV